LLIREDTENLLPGRRIRLIGDNPDSTPVIPTAHDPFPLSAGTTLTLLTGTVTLGEQTIQPPVPLTKATKASLPEEMDAVLTRFASGWWAKLPRGQKVTTAGSPPGQAASDGPSGDIDSTLPHPTLAWLDEQQSAVDRVLQVREATLLGGTIIPLVLSPLCGLTEPKCPRCSRSNPSGTSGPLGRPEVKWRTGSAEAALPGPPEAEPG